MHRAQKQALYSVHLHSAHGLQESVKLTEQARHSFRASLAVLSSMQQPAILLQGDVRMQAAGRQESGASL